MSNFREREYIPQYPPEHNHTEHSPDHSPPRHCFMKPRKPVLQRLCRRKDSKKRNCRHHQRIMSESPAYIQMEKSMQRPLRTAPGTFKPGKHQKRAFRKPHGIRRVKSHIKEDCGGNCQDNYDTKYRPQRTRLVQNRHPA